jgi:phosphoribosylanthranilate isomerase
VTAVERLGDGARGPSKGETRVRVKICGVTRLEDAEACAEAGVDLVGVNLVAGSPRRVTVEVARSIARRLRGRVEVVGVVADEAEAVLRRLLDDAELDRLQLHGHEPPALVEALGARAFKAVRVGSLDDVALARGYGGALLLVDAKVAGVLGGTGRRVDPALVAPLAAERPVLLAGGLGPENVAEAVRAVRPFGVDAASGVESRPGVKDRRKVAAFVAAARGA